MRKEIIVCNVATLTKLSQDEKLHLQLAVVVHLHRMDPCSGHKSGGVVCHRHVQFDLRQCAQRRVDGVVLFDILSRHGHL